MASPRSPQRYLAESKEVIDRLDFEQIERMADLLAAVRARGGRLFILGVGGSAANASHAVNDFRKIAGIETYAPTDNVSELTARTNDEGWATIFESWLRVSRLRADDAILVFSVGGGNLEKNVSPNLVAALEFARVHGRNHSRHRGPRRRPYRPRRRCLRHRSDRQHGPRHTSCGDIPDRGVALTGISSEGETSGHEVGIRPLIVLQLRA